MSDGARDEISVRARTILERLPHFCNSREAGWLLLRFVDLFGHQLEEAEVDLLRVLRAHHVETSGNEGSPGFTAPAALRGDLDKIFALYLEAVGGTTQLVQVSPRFTVRSVEPARLCAYLGEKDAPLSRFIRARLKPETVSYIDGYPASQCRFRGEEIGPGFALALLLRDDPVSRFLSEQLGEELPSVAAQLQAYDAGGSLTAGLAERLAEFLNASVLGDRALYLKCGPYLDECLEIDANPLRVEAARDLLYAIFRSHLWERSQDELDEPRRSRLLRSLEGADPIPAPPGDHLVRLNRLLLDTAAARSRRSWGFHAREIPSRPRLREALAAGLNSLLQLENLYAPERFPELAVHFPSLLEQMDPDRESLNRRLLESALSGCVEPSEAPYRERLLALIRVLRRGASTREGIRAVVAANLGIVGNDPEVRAARELIRIEEYDPERTFFAREVPLSLGTEFEVLNPNPEPAVPEVRVHILERLPESATDRLANVRMIDVATGRGIRWDGQLRAGDYLGFQGQSASLNGAELTLGVEGVVPTVPGASAGGAPGAARWRFEADLVAPDGNAYPAGRLAGEGGGAGNATGAAVFDGAVFAHVEPVAEVDVGSYQFHPGTFTVTMPWHIPGFTDKFVESNDHPRQQILGLVERVKAAGVRARIAYRQVFAEEHGAADCLQLAMEGSLLLEDHQSSDALELDSRQSGHESHDVGEALILAGCFDYTTFDSLNTFA